MKTPTQIPVGVRDNERDMLLEEDAEDNSANSSPSGKKARSPVANCWTKFDKRIMKPMLTSSQPSLVQTLPEWCFPFALCFTSREQLSSDEEMEAVVAHNTNGSPGNNSSGGPAMPMQPTKRSDSNTESLISGD